MQFNEMEDFEIKRKKRFDPTAEPALLDDEWSEPKDEEENIDFLPEKKTNGAVNFGIAGVLLAVIFAFCAVAAFLTPSGVLMQENEMANINSKTASEDIENGISSMKSNIIGEVMNLPKVYLLPISGKGGTAFDKSNKSTYKDDRGIKHQVYEDPTIRVDIWPEKGTANDKRYVATYAKIKIAHPTQIRTAISTTGYANRSKARKIAKGVNAILAINGDFYTLRKTGIIIKQGTKYKNSSASRETLFIDENGDFNIMPASTAIKTKYLETHTVYNTMSFGPPLVKNGKLCHYTSTTKDHIAAMHFGQNPRTGIGQLGPLEYLCIVVDGRVNNSWGITTNAFAKLFYKAGCTNAYNLDGGQSATMVYLNDVINAVSNSGERNIADIIYFASAYPKGGAA